VQNSVADINYKPSWHPRAMHVLPEFLTMVRGDSAIWVRFSVMPGNLLYSARCNMCVPACPSTDDLFSPVRRFSGWLRRFSSGWHVQAAWSVLILAGLIKCWLHQSAWPGGGSIAATGPATHSWRRKKANCK